MSEIKEEQNPKFSLGQVVATRGVADMVSSEDITRLLKRHVTGDWGDLEEEDRQANEDALVEGTRLFSAYAVGNQRIWIITEWDRSVTTILLPEEY